MRYAVFTIHLHKRTLRHREVKNLSQVTQQVMEVSGFQSSIYICTCHAMMDAL